MGAGQSEISGALRAELSAAQQIGAIGPGPLESHIDHARGFLTAIGDQPPGNSLLDLGTGGGLPGLVLSELCPDLAVSLLDGRSERAAQLRARIERLGWQGRATVIGGRAEEVGHGEERGHFDLVVARGFGRPGVTAECGAAFLVEGGLFVISDPPNADPQIRWPAAGLAQLGLELVRHLHEPYAFAVLRATEPCPERYPRRTGVPNKRPLF